MRLRLILVSLAVSTMVAVAFSVPLALLIRDVARDRAVTAAERDAAALGPVLALSTERAALEPALERTVSGSRRRMSIVLDDGTLIGAPAPTGANVARLATARRTRNVDVHGGVAVVQPFALAAGRSATVVVFVPDGALRRGVASSWALLGLVAAALVAGSVAVADRLAAAVVRPTRRLAHAAAALGAGDLDTRVEPDGPTEIAEVASAFNELAGRIRQLLADERELVADLSHRLRTPLTALRLDADALGPGDAPDRDRADATRLETAVSAVIHDARNAGERVVTPVDASELVAERAEFWAPLAEEQARSCSVDLTRGAVVGLAADDLRAAIDALMSNVFTHTPEGAGVRLTVSRRDAMVVVAVEDDGPGLPDGALDRGASGGGSTGLGLDIVRRTAESAGGSIETGRSASGGARVGLRLPLVAPD